MKRKKAAPKVSKMKASASKKPAKSAEKPLAMGLKEAAPSKAKRNKKLETVTL